MHLMLCSCASEINVENSKPVMTWTRRLSFSEKLSTYSFLSMIVQRTWKRNTSRSVDHLTTTTSTEVSQMRTAIIALPRRSWAKLVVVDNQEVIVLRPYRTSALEQQPSIDLNDPTWRHMNVDELQPDPNKPIRHTSTCPWMMLDAPPRRGEVGRTLFYLEGATAVWSSWAGHKS